MMGEDFERQPKRVCVDALSSKMTTTLKNDDTTIPFPPGEELPAEVNITHLLQQSAELNVWQSCVKICLIIC